MCVIELNILIIVISFGLYFSKFKMGDFFMMVVLGIN